MPQTQTIRRIDTYFKAVALAKANYGEEACSVPFADIYSMSDAELVALAAAVNSVKKLHRKRVTQSAAFSEEENSRIEKHEAKYTPVVEAAVEKPPIVEEKAEEPPIEEEVEVASDGKRRTETDLRTHLCNIEYFKSRDQPGELEKYIDSVVIVSDERNRENELAYAEALKVPSAAMLEKLQTREHARLKKKKGKKGKGKQVEEEELPMLTVEQEKAEIDAINEANRRRFANPPRNPEYAIRDAVSKCKRYKAAVKAHAKAVLEGVDNPTFDPSNCEEMRPTGEDRELYKTHVKQIKAARRKKERAAKKAIDDRDAAIEANPAKYECPMY